MEEKNNKIEYIGCKSYYIYYSTKTNNYVITEHALEAMDNPTWISLKDEKVSDLIKLLQDHELILEKNKANLSEQDFIKSVESNPKRSKKILGKLLNIAQIGVKSIKIP